MTKQLRFSFLLLSILGNLVFTSSSDATLNGNLTIKIEGLKNSNGQVCLNLFASSRGFPDKSDRAVQKRCVKLTQNLAQVTFENLKTGNYAVTAVHDANNDNTLNRNTFGIPKEGVGFSMNPRILTGPPSFGDSSFLVSGPNTNIQIQLRYFLGG